MNLNTSPSPFPISHDHDHDHFTPNSLSCQIFFGPTQDQTGYNQKGDDYPYHGGSTYEMKNKVSNGLKLTLWKKEDTTGLAEENPAVKWMSSKMRLMQKMKKNPEINTKKCDDQKIQPSSSLETDVSSYTSSYNNNNTQIRVCADCNTTKTPLWRSGPKGPKSLCNACGIRQRKARRAMAAAASDQPPTPTTPTAMKIKPKNVHFKKRFKMAAGSPSNGKKKIDLEDFLVNLSNNLAFHRVFPEEEKDAAILLMALSSGLVHG